MALVLVVPLGFYIQRLAEERAMGDAERRAATVAAVLALTTDRDTVGSAVAAAERNDGWAGVGAGGSGRTDGSPADPATTSAGRVAVHGLRGGILGPTRADPRDVRRATERAKMLVVDVPGGRARLEPVRLGSGIAVVEVFVPAAELRDGVETAWWTLLAAAALMVLASVVVGDRVAARTVRSARALSSAAIALGDGNIDARVHPSGPRELAEAGLAFNRMAERMGQSRTNERELVADLSHRLRTPLTVLRLDAESLVEAGTEDDAHALLETGEMFLGTPEEADRRRTIRRIRQAVATLEQEIDVLIRTTRQVVSTEEPTTQDLCDASDVVRERMQFWAAVAGDQNRPVSVLGTQRAAPVRLARAELAAALDAVLGNVFRYTPQGTAFEVAVSRRDGYVAVRVDDAGQGIQDPDRALRRGSSDRGSTGLGLDIARRATLAGQGSVSIDRARLGGASVVMLFRDAEAAPRQVNRFGLIGRLAREPGSRRWSKSREKA